MIKKLSVYIRNHESFKKSKHFSVEFRKHEKVLDCGAVSSAKWIFNSAECQYAYDNTLISTD